MLEKIQMAMALAAAMMVCAVGYLVLLAFMATVLRLGVVRYTLGFGPVVTRTPTFDLRAVPLTASFLPATRNALFLVPPSLRSLLGAGQLRWLDDLPLAIALSLCFA